jgi:hypothetical protein
MVVVVGAAMLAAGGAAMARPPVRASTPALAVAVLVVKPTAVDTVSGVYAAAFET